VHTVDDVKALGARVRNWGRWGPDDELGTLNYITAEHRRAAAGLVQTGAVFSLSLPLDRNGPMVGAAGRTNPARFMVQSGTDARSHFDIGGGASYTDDFVTMPLQSSTQWDALAHVHYDGRFFNDAAVESVDGFGAARNGIDKVHDRFVSRGVLLDIARLHDVALLDPGYAIRADDLEAAETRAGVEVGEADIVLLRTGTFGEHDRTGTWSVFQQPVAGVHFETAAWFHERRVAAVASDNMMVEAPGIVAGVALPFHMIALRDMGLHLGELWYLEGLAAHCAEVGVYEFLLVAPALRFTGGVGSPVNPIALM
jgi:kynurenine formamidase